MLLPIIQNLIKVSPALVHSIGTGKKCRITHQTVFQQAYIRIPRFLIVLVIAEVHLHGSHIETGTRFFHAVDADSEEEKMQDYHTVRGIR